MLKKKKTQYALEGTSLESTIKLKEVMHTFQDSEGTCHILENEVDDLMNLSEHQRDCELLLYLR